MMARISPHLGTPQRALLNEVLVRPGLGELGRLPCLIYCQQRQVVALRLEELGLLLIRLPVHARRRQGMMPDVLTG